jgi:hypothetical protein
MYFLEHPCERASIKAHPALQLARQAQKILVCIQGDVINPRRGKVGSHKPVIH